MELEELSDPLYSSLIGNFELLHHNEVPYHYLLYIYIYIYITDALRDMSLYNLEMKYVSDRTGGRNVSLKMGSILIKDLQEIQEYQNLGGEQVPTSRSVVAPDFQVCV